MTRPAPLILPGLVALVVALGTPAHADPTPEASAERGTETPEQKRGRALALFDQSVLLFDSGKFRDAAALLEVAYATFPEPVLLYNLARAYQESGELAKTIDAYERFLAADPNTKDRGGIEQRVVTLREQLRVAEQRKADEASRAAQTKSTPDSRAAPRANTTSTQSPPPDESQTHGTSIVPWIVAGTGALALGTGAVLGLVASDRHESAKSEPDSSKASAAQDQAESFALAANVTLVAGGVLAVAGTAWGVVLLASSPNAKSDHGTRTRLAVGPGSARFTLNF